MDLQDVMRLIEPVINRVQTMFGLMEVIVVNNLGLLQKITGTGMGGDSLTEVPYYQNYGFESSPLPGTEAVVGFLGGQPNNGMVSVVYDKIARPLLLPGGVSVYDALGNSMTLTPAGIIIKDTTLNSITINPAGIQMTSNTGAGILLDATGVTFISGDGFLWKPNILPNCLFNGAPHGGPLAGITRLKAI